MNNMFHGYVIEMVLNTFTCFFKTSTVPRGNFLNIFPRMFGNGCSIAKIIYMQMTDKNFTCISRKCCTALMKMHFNLNMKISVSYVASGYSKKELMLKHMKEITEEFMKHSSSNLPYKW